MSPHDQTSDIQEQLRAQIDTINDAIRRLHDRELTDMNRVDNDVARICASIATGDTPHTEHLEALMAEMINRLDDLARALEDYKRWAAENK